MKEKLFSLDGSEYSPSISYYANDWLVLEGESRLENPKVFYTDLMITIETKLQNLAPKCIEYRFEYISSSSILSIIELMTKLQSKYNIEMIWSCEKLDEDILELGEIIRESHNIPLKFNLI